MSAFIVVGDDPDLLRRFAGEVAPATRELVAAARGSSATPGGAAAATGAATTTTATGAAADPPVESTVDDHERLTQETGWDESTRPTGPAPDPDRTYTAHERAAGQHLVDVHDHLRAELRQLRDLIEQVAAGATEADSARSHIHTMTIRQNNWTVGAYCESYCRVLTTHHTLEDASMFPYLRTADPALAPVIDRLAEEHRAIHEILERVDRALVAFVAGPDGAKGLTAAVDLLADALLSHLSYEERELVEPLSRLGYG